MSGKDGGLINRIMMGSEKSEEYARASLPSNRWELFWDILKGRFWKLVLLNLITLVFFLPLIAWFLFSKLTTASFGAVIPYSQGFGIGYQARISMVGVASSVEINSAVMINLFLPLCFIILALGLSGSAFVMRNMVWTEGIFVANDFVRGIKKNAGQLILFYLLASIVCYVCLLSIALCNNMIEIGTSLSWLLYIAKIVSYILLALICLMLIHGTSLAVTYKMKFFALIKNSFIFSVVLIPQNIFFFVCGCLPFIFILFGGFMEMVGFILIIFFGLSFMMLVWTDFCQWSYDKFINDKIIGAKKNRGIYEKVKATDSKSIKQYREQLAYSAPSSFDKPVKPITDDELKIEELPESFNRSDIEKLNKSKEAIYLDNEQYVKEHTVITEESLEREKAFAKEEEERNKRIEKAKKELSKRKKKR